MFNLPGTIEERNEASELTTYNNTFHKVTNVQDQNSTLYNTTLGLNQGTTIDKTQN